MKVILFFLFVLFLIAGSSISYAHPIVIETPETSVFVVPVWTQWEPAPEKRAEIEERISAPFFSYGYVYRGKRVWSHGGLTYSRTENELTPLIEGDLIKAGKKARRAAGMGTFLNVEEQMSPYQAAAVIEAGECFRSRHFVGWNVWSAELWQTCGCV
jgi:hypothetical protein